MEKSPTSCKNKEDSAAIPCMDKLRQELSCAVSAYPVCLCCSIYIYLVSSDLNFE